jgi:hypothetical protein
MTWFLSSAGFAASCLALLVGYFAFRPRRLQPAGKGSSLARVTEPPAGDTRRQERRAASFATNGRPLRRSHRSQQPIHSQALVRLGGGPIAGRSLFDFAGTDSCGNVLEPAHDHRFRKCSVEPNGGKTLRVQVRSLARRRTILRDHPDGGAAAAGVSVEAVWITSRIG